MSPPLPGRSVSAGTSHASLSRGSSPEERHESPFLLPIRGSDPSGLGYGRDGVTGTPGVRGASMGRRLGGPRTGLAIVGFFTFAVGYGGYRAIRHLMGWTVDAQAPSGPLRIEIEDAMLRRVDVSDSKVELTSDLLGMFGATLVVT